MSKLNLQPEFELGSSADTAHGLPELNEPALDGSARPNAQLRSTRRRLDATRLRLTSDDGFHLFRIY